MTSFKGNALLIAIGLVLIHTVTCQPTATVTESTVVWSAQAETVAPAPGGETLAETPTTTAATAVDTATTTVAAEGVPPETTAAPTTAPAPTTPGATTAPTNQNQPIDQGTSNQMTSQQYTQTGTAPTAPSAPADAAIRQDVMATVLALLNETGYAGSANDANVQEIVKMLMNGTVPTDMDLMRLGIIPTQVPVTTPPTYTIPVANPLEPVINLLPPVTPAPTPAPTLDLLAPAQSGAGTNVLPALPGGFPFPSNVFSGLVPPTTPKPLDPFSQSNLGNPLPPNSIAPKPAPVDLLSSFNFPSTGTSGGMAPPPSGILDTQYQQQQQRQRQQGMNPMMMMMMLAPEMMETMMSGENPMLTMMFMQSMQQSQRPQQPPTPPMGSSLTPGSGFPSAGAGAGGFMDPNFGGMPAAGAGGSFMDLNSLTGANIAPNPMGGAGTSSNLMPLLNMINQPAGSPALPGMPPTGSALPPMDMATLLSNFGTPPTGGAAAPTGATGPTDMTFANLISPGTQPTGVSPTLDPFGAMG